MSSDVDIYNTPVVPPPDGQTSNFNPGWSGVQLATIIVFAVTYFLATVSMVMRYVTSAFVLRQWELDVGRFPYPLRHTWDTNELTELQFLLLWLGAQHWDTSFQYLFAWRTAGVSMPGISRWLRSSCTIMSVKSFSLLTRR
jgi:hypothetical protein